MSGNQKFNEKKIEGVGGVYKSERNFFLAMSLFLKLSFCAQ